jgi:hypothetical protein
MDRASPASTENAFPRFEPLSRAIVALLAFMAFAAPCQAYQSSAWKHLASEHFVVSYDQRTEPLAQAALRIAEDTREELCSYFGEFPADRKIAIVLSDASDLPNGETSERDYRIAVDCRKAQSLFRGESDWLRTVLTHELSHAYTLAMMRSPLVLRIWEGLYAGQGSLESETSFGSNRIPVWFVEGLAQMGSNRVGADSRDPIREMLLRDAALGGRLLDLAQMARFEGSSLDYELAYNQGYSLLLYLEKNYATVPLKGLCSLIRQKGFAPAFDERYGESIESLYGKWKAELLALSAREDSLKAGERVSDRKGPLVLETACAADSSYVIANWGNDYERFGLFKKGRGGSYSRIAADTGTNVKADPVSGEIWFSEEVYDYSSGVKDYDLFKANPAEGKPRRMTRGARCLAFDAYDGHLIYATYRDGETIVMSRKPDGAETALARLPYGIAIHSISALTRETALLGLGAGDASRVGILADGAIRYLWEGADATDPVALGEDRVAFCSSVGGSPQIYWADLAEDPRTWYQITDAPAGARFPCAGGLDAGARLYYSRFEEGGYRLYSLDHPFNKERPRRIEEGGLAEAKPVSAEIAYPGYANARGVLINPVCDFWPISIGVTGHKTDSGASSSTDWSLQGGLGASVYDAPGDMSLVGSLAVQAPVFRENSLDPAVSATIEGGFALGPARATLGYVFQTESEFYNGWTYSYEFRQAYALADFQVAANQKIRAQYSYNGATDTTQAVAAEYFRLDSAGLRWNFGYSPLSRYDPADLGGDWHSAYLGAYVDVPSFPDLRYYRQSYYLRDTRQIYHFSGGAAFHALLAGGKLGIGASASGLCYFGAVKGSAYAPNVLPTIGGSDSFSGYPSSYALVNDLASASIELEVNPFVDATTRATPIQRLSLSLGCEAGVARCFEGGLEVEMPLSLQASLRYRFFEAPNRASSAYLSFAMPLNDFMGSLQDKPFQIYAGLSY